MALRKRLKKVRKRLHKEPPKRISHNKVTGYAANTSPVCSVCKCHKPFNWHVRLCANVMCKGRYSKPQRRSLKKAS